MPLQLKKKSRKKIILSPLVSSRNKLMLMINQRKKRKSRVVKLKIVRKNRSKVVRIKSRKMFIKNLRKASKRSRKK